MSTYRDKNKVTSLDDFKLKKMIYERGHFLREFPDRYEYCFVRNYENLYDNFQLDSVELAGHFVQLLTVKDRVILVSIEFSKSDFDISLIIQYLDFYGFKLMEINDDYLPNGEIYKGLLFKGRPLVFFERTGFSTRINKSEFIEVTKKFKHSIQKIDTFNSKERDSISSQMRIIFNGEELNYIPEIEIDLTKDLILSNGHIIVASYIGTYFDTIGFYANRGDSLPVMWIQDINTKIYIDTHNLEGQKIINVQHNYSIDIEDLIYN